MRGNGRMARGCERLLVATDLSARSDRALERAVALARECGAQLTVVHVVDGELPVKIANRQAEEAKDLTGKQLARFRSDDLRVHVKVLFGRDYEEIIRAATEAAADLVVLGIHRNEASVELFRGSTMERVLRLGNAPCLVVKDFPQERYRRVVVAVDFSVHSRRAIEFAARFVPKIPLHLVHAYSVPFRGFLYGADTQQQVAKQQQDQMEQMVEEERAAFLSSLDMDRPVLEWTVREGPVRQVIHVELERLGANLLIVGTHGRTGIAHALLGSLAEELLRRPPCDIVAVKAW